MLSLPQNEPLQLAGTLEEVPSLPAAAALQTAMLARADIRSFGQQREAAQRSGVARQRGAEADGGLRRQLPVPGGRRVAAAAQHDSRSYQFGLAISVPLFSAPTVAARRGAACARQSGRAWRERGARRRPPRAGVGLDAVRCRRLTSSRPSEKAVELARESLTIAEVYGLKTASSRPPSSTMRACRCSKRKGELTPKAKHARIVAAARTRTRRACSSQRQPLPLNPRDSETADDTSAVTCAHRGTRGHALQRSPRAGLKARLHEYAHI